MDENTTDIKTVEEMNTILDGFDKTHPELVHEVSKAYHELRGILQEKGCNIIVAHEITYGFLVATLFKSIYDPPVKIDMHVHRI